jgi:hypothetical protein
MRLHKESESRFFAQFTPAVFSTIFLKDGLKKGQKLRHIILVQSTNSMEDSLSSEADSLSASQDISRFYVNLIFIALFKIAFHLPLFSAKYIQSTLFNPIY